MRLLTKVFKVYNKVELKSVNITGYHLAKSLAESGESKVNIDFYFRSLKRVGSASTKLLSIDIV